MALSPKRPSPTTTSTTTPAATTKSEKLSHAVDLSTSYHETIRVITTPVVVSNPSEGYHKPISHPVILTTQARRVRNDINLHYHRPIDLVNKGVQKKFSQSGRHWKPSSSSNIKDQSSAPASLNLDADGFTIPPQDRDRPPWELDAHAEELISKKKPIKWLERSSTNDTARHNFAIKPTRSSSENTLSSTSVNGVGLMGGTRRSNTALRGRRADGRGVTMYDPPSLPDPGSTSLLRRVFQPPSKTIEPRNSELSSRSLSDNSSPTKTLTSTNNFKKHDEEEGHGLSRSNSFTSNISNSNLARYGFMNILPPLPPPPHPTTTTTTSKNPFINMFSPSNSISTHDINHQPEELTESITESHDLSFPTNKPSSSTTPKINHPHLFKVVEKVNVLMDHGSVTKLLIIGQVFITRKIVVQLITNLSGSGSDTEDKKSLSFDIRGLDRLEKLVYPDELVSPIQTDKDINKDPTDKIGRYNIDLNRLLSVFTSSSQEEGEEEGEQVCILKYRVFIDPKLTSIQDYHNLASQFVPLIVVPKWRFSHHKTELVINYHLSENFKLFHSNTSSSSEEDGSSKKMKKNVIDHQSLPIGKFDPQDNSIQWDIPSPSSSNTEDTDERKSSGSGGIKLDGLKGKLICRLFILLLLPTLLLLLESLLR
ncbi:hypothetical protein KEM48_005881 [Puccinia striiformis f. sp. tritici PST-130]|nr:hypothetical protein KEM48_005881 [Puccinia striiformis f. sp. tritici PST-130]